MASGYWFFVACLAPRCSLSRRSLDRHGYGEEKAGFPNWSSGSFMNGRTERRVDPQLELKVAPATIVQNAPVIPPIAPLAWSAIIRGAFIPMK